MLSAQPAVLESANDAWQRSRSTGSTWKQCSWRGCESSQPRATCAGRPCWRPMPPVRIRSDRRNLRRVAEAGITECVKMKDAESGPGVLLVNADMLSRYEATLLDDLRRRCEPPGLVRPCGRSGCSCPGPTRMCRPCWAERLIPVLGTQWLRLPPEWLRIDETELAEGGAA